MIIHNIVIRESGQDGLIAILEPHEFPQDGQALRLVVESNR